MNIDQLLAIAPVGARAREFIGPLNAAMERFGIITNVCQAAFVAQALHESSNFSRMSENLNYSPAALMATFNTKTKIRFTPEIAALYGRTAAHPANQQMIANVAYANRMGNGSIESGDGWRYRGRGPGQLTGKDNFVACGTALGVDLLASPDLVALPEQGCAAFAWFWAKGNPTGKSLNILAENGKFDAVSVAINGGHNGLVERRVLTIHALGKMA